MHQEAGRGSYKLYVCFRLATYRIFDAQHHIAIIFLFINVNVLQREQTGSEVTTYGVDLMKSSDVAFA